MFPPRLVTTLAAHVDGRWQPGIGDPTAPGWLTVAVYALAAIACCLAASRTAATRGPWMAFAVILVLLTANKALDLQSWFTQVGRRPEIHGPGQVVGVAAFALLGMVAIAASLYALIRRSVRPSVWLASAALIYQVDFIIIRAISLHGVDRFLGAAVGPFRLNHAFELAGLCAVISAALGSARSVSSGERAAPGLPGDRDG